MPESSSQAQTESDETHAPAEPGTIGPTTVGRVACVAVLALMVSSMAYLTWIVVRYWTKVGV